METTTFKFKSVGIFTAICEFAPGESREIREDYFAMVEGRVRRESAGWGRETTTKAGKAKELKQPKAVQKVGWGETPTLTIGQHAKTVIPSTACGQLALLDEAYAQLEKHGVGYFAGIRAESYLSGKLAEMAKEFKPAGEPVQQNA